MKDQKYKRSKYDHRVYLRRLEDGSYIYLLLYVDDMLIAAKSQIEIDKLKAQLSKEFEMKDLGGSQEDSGHGDKQGQGEGKTLAVTEAVFAEGTTTFWYTRRYKTCKYPTCSSFEIE